MTKQRGIRSTDNTMTKQRGIRSTDNKMTKQRGIRSTDNTMTKRRGIRSTDNTMTKQRGIRSTDNKMTKQRGIRSTDNTMTKQRGIRSTDNAMTKRKRTNWYSNIIYTETKDRATQTPLKTSGKCRCKSLVYLQRKCIYPLKIVVFFDLEKRRYNRKKMLCSNKNMRRGSQFFRFLQS
jgi:hypothetical protein